MKYKANPEKSTALRFIGNFFTLSEWLTLCINDESWKIMEILTFVYSVKLLGSL